MELGQTGDRQDDVAILANVIRGDLIPLFFVGMFYRGLQLVGKSLVCLAALEVESAREHAPQGLEHFGTA